MIRPPKRQRLTERQKLQRDLDLLKETARRASQGRWYRTHSAIVCQGNIVAVAETDIIMRAGYTMPTDPRKDADNTRHITATAPSAILDLIERIERALSEQTC